MALTQRTGALAQAGNQAASIASAIANLAASAGNLHYTGGSAPVRQYGQEFTPAPAPVYRGNQGTFTPAPASAAAARQIIQRAQANQQVKRNVFDVVAQQAIANAVAVAGGRQPGRAYTPPPQPVYRLSAVQPNNRFTPEQEGQLFDQQIQATKLAASQQGMPGVFTPDPIQQQRIAAINRQVEQMQGGFANAQPNPRLTQEQAVLQAFPQMTPQELRGRDTGQLQAMLDLANQPPAAPTNAGGIDQPTATVAPPDEMTHHQPPKGPPPQPSYSPLPTWDTTRGAPPQPPYSPLPTGPAMVSAAFSDALTQGKPIAALPEVGSGNTSDGGGGFLSNVLGAASDAAGDFLSPLGPIGTIISGGKAIWDLRPDEVDSILEQVKSSAAGTYEAFVSTPPGQAIMGALETGMNALDRGRQENAENYGNMFTDWANGDDITWMPGGRSNPLNAAAALPVFVIGELLEEQDPEIRDKIKDVAANGYSSPSYVALVEKSGVDPAQAGPEFTGDRAVWEYLMSLTDGLPPAVKYPLRMLIDTTIDPLTYLAGVGAAGRAGRLTGVAMRTSEDASLGGRVVGGVLEGLGAAVEGGAKLPDLPVEGLARGGTKLGGKVGEVTGLLSPSTSGLRRDADGAVDQLDTALIGARESVPDTEARVAFDAEAQGVAPTSGPELIEVVNQAPIPTVTKQVSGEDVVTRGTATATLDGPGAVRDVDATTASVTGATGTRYPTFESLRDAPRSTADNPIKLYRYNGQDLLIRTGTGQDGVPFFSASPRKATAANQMVTADSYTALMDALPAKFGGEHPPFRAGGSRRTGTPPKSERVSPRSLSEARDLENYLRAEGADEETIQGAVQDFLNARFADERDAAAATSTATPKPPTTKVERDAAAAAGSTPETPRTRAASETVRAAENAKGKPGTNRRLTAAEKKSHPNLAKAQARSDRLAKEDAEGLPKQVNKILGAQKPGEHEFSPIYGGHRPLDQIVTKAIDSKDPALMKRADQFVKKVDAAVEEHLRTDGFYKTWKNGGVPVKLQEDARFTDEFFEQMRVLDPEADPFRLRVLANGLAKGTLDDIAELGFQLNHLFPMLIQDYADEFTLDGILGAVGRIESRDFRAESSAWLIREYLDTPDPARAETILQQFLAGNTELPVIADGVHKPYAHSIVAEHQAESIARLTQMRDQWRTIKRSQATQNWGQVVEQAETAFREADRAAQMAGGKKGASKSLSAQFAAAQRATERHIPSNAEVLAAIGEIRDPEISGLLLKGDGRLTVEQARLADRAMPEGWRPPGYAGDKTGWNLKEALDWAREEKFRNPAFDHAKARDEIAQLAHGLQPKRTATQIKSMRKAAEAQGIDPKTIVDGTSNMERLTATRGVRALDAYLRQYRALRLFNPIIGLPNRLQDILGNSTAHLIGRDPMSAIRQVPLTFTEAKAFRDASRDPGKLLGQWAGETPHMRETGMTYNPLTFNATKLADIDATTGLPPINARAAGTPRVVRTAASAWTSPALKDMTTAGEMVGRKLAFDRVYVDTIRREAFPAFKEYLTKRFPDQADQMLRDIAGGAEKKGGKTWEGMFSAEDVGRVADEDAARAWQRELNRAAQKGDAEADHLFFKGRMTNADELARRTLTFHFWMVRASALYGRTMLRNPILLSGFYRLYEHAQEIAREQGLPDWLSTMMKFYTIPGAGSGYAAMDPIGMLFPTFFLDAYSQEGNKFQAIQNLMLPPWSAALGAVGLTQNIPDVTGTRTIERFVVDMGNFLKGEGVPLESIPLFGQYINQDSLQLTIPTEEFTKKIIDAANNLIGQPLGDFKPFDRQANEEDQLASIGWNVGMGLWGPDPNAWPEGRQEEIIAAIHQAQYGDGEETWLAETIRATYGREGGARAGMSLLIPGGVVTRQTDRDAQLEAASGYWADFYAGKPTTKEGEIAAGVRQMATSAQPAWVAMNNDYYKIGTDQEQQIYSSVTDMFYSPEDLNPHQSIIIDNGNGMFTVYNMAQLAALSKDDREQVVWAWLNQNKGAADAYTKVKDGRDAFKTEHPDYAQYSEYQNGVYQYDGGPAQFRRDMRDNPTFKAAEDAQRERLKNEGKSGAVLEAELDQWATTQAAFFAATGQKWKNSDEIKGTPGPSSVAAMFSLRKDEQGSGSGEKKPAEKKDPTVDDYWSPAKGVPRLAQDQAQWEHDNRKMEQDFGPYWNEATGDWEDNADSASERKKLGITERYILPSVSETMKRYEDWEEDHPGGTPEEFFTEMLQTEGFGKRVQVEGTSTPALPGGRVVTQPVGVAAVGRVNTPVGKLQASVQQFRPVTNAPKVGSRPEESAAAQQVVKVANSFVGKVPYQWGSIPGKGEDPTGWDCSGMTYWLDQNYGSGELPMGSHYQYQYAQETGKLFTDLSELQPGDIVFIDTGWMGGAGAELNRSGHVGIYAGNGQLINALNPDAGTVIEPLSDFDTILGAMHGSWNS